MNKYIELGKISGFFGVKGWVKLFSYTRPRLGIGDYKTFYLGDSKAEVRFTAIKESGKHIVGHIQGVDSRDDALRYQDQSLYVKRSSLPKLDNEYYWHELIGLAVENTAGEPLGEIKSLMETGANDVMVIQNQQHGEILIPYVMSHFIVSVDLTAGKMIVDWETDD